MDKANGILLRKKNGSEVTILFGAEFKAEDAQGDNSPTQVSLAPLTQEDKEEIANMVLAALRTPVIGSVDAQNNVVLTGELASGTYTFSYEMADGSLVEIGQVVV